MLWNAVADDRFLAADLAQRVFATILIPLLKTFKLSREQPMVLHAALTLPSCLTSSKTCALGLMRLLLMFFMFLTSFV
jgi:hypothetical protein